MDMACDILSLKNLPNRERMHINGDGTVVKDSRAVGILE